MLQFDYSLNYNLVNIVTYMPFTNIQQEMNNKLPKQSQLEHEAEQTPIYADVFHFKNLSSSRTSMAYFIHP